MSRDILEEFEHQRGEPVYPSVPARLGLVVEDRASGFCGDVVAITFGSSIEFVLAYLGAVKATNSDDGAEAIAKMKESPIDDSLFGRVVVRADGRAIHDMYLFRAKKPEESKGPWDYYSLVSTIPADRAFRPLDQGGCALVRK